MSFQRPVGGVLYADRGSGRFTEDSQRSHVEQSIVVREQFARQDGRNGTDERTGSLLLEIRLHPDRCSRPRSGTQGASLRNLLTPRSARASLGTSSVLSMPRCTGSPSSDPCQLSSE